ncbi:hypothetical protein HDU83_001433 [Entophlyctis luteolus]|nr:hypothetical protein HDU83_001433 [Entophlyctis luteolus]
MDAQTNAPTTLVHRRAKAKAAADAATPADILASVQPVATAAEAECAAAAAPSARVTQESRKVTADDTSLGHNDTGATDCVAVVSSWEPVVTQMTTIVALGIAIPILYKQKKAFSMWLLYTLYINGALAKYVVPNVQIFLGGISVKDIPNLCVLALVILGYCVSDMVSTVAKAASEEGLDCGVRSYSGIVLRIKHAHEATVTAIPLLATAVLLSAQMGVAQTTRAQLSHSPILVHTADLITKTLPQPNQILGVRSGHACTAVRVHGGRVRVHGRGDARRVSERVPAAALLCGRARLRKDDAVWLVVPRFMRRSQIADESSNLPLGGLDHEFAALRRYIDVVKGGLVCKVVTVTNDANDENLGLATRLMKASRAVHLEVTKDERTVADANGELPVCFAAACLIWKMAGGSYDDASDDFMDDEGGVDGLLAKAA